MFGAKSCSLCVCLYPVTVVAVAFSLLRTYDESVLRSYDVPTAYVVPGRLTCDSQPVPYEIRQCGHSLSFERMCQEHEGLLSPDFVLNGVW